MLATLAGATALGGGDAPARRAARAHADPRGAAAGLGFGLAALRSALVAAPVLPYEMTASIEGRVVGLDRSASDRPRVLLDSVVIHGMEPSETPERVRISLDPATPVALLQPGLRLLGQARLSPPAAPTEPGGFDYRRLAWFERIGAVGYARTPMVEAYGPDPGSLRQLPFRARMAASAHIQRLVPGQDGAFTSAILTGDRSGIDRSVEAALRASSLYHIVSISGLHMTLLAAAVFAMIRYGLALVPRLALAWPLKKIAASVALVAGAAYLVISGLEVPAQRSYVMTATVLVAVLLDRPALTMRAVALAALIVLALMPESLMQPGFQMSFAATIALVAVFEGLRAPAWWRHTQTAPALAFREAGRRHRHDLAGRRGRDGADLGLPFQHHRPVRAGGEPAGGAGDGRRGDAGGGGRGRWSRRSGSTGCRFQIAGLGMGYIIAVARFVAGLGGAVTGVPAGPPASLALILIGGIMAVLWIGRGRWAALPPVALGHGALGGARPSGRDDRRQRPAVRDQDRRGAGAVERPRQRLRGGELAAGRRRLATPGRSLCAAASWRGEEPHRRRRVPGMGGVALCRGQQRGAGGARAAAPRPPS